MPEVGFRQTFRPVIVECTECHCTENVTQGWAVEDETFVGRVAKLIDDGFGLPRPSSGHLCSCPRHTGVGLIPRLKLRVQQR